MLFIFKVYKTKNKEKITKSWLGFAIMAILITIALSILYKQFDYNPAVTAYNLEKSDLTAKEKTSGSLLAALPEQLTPMTSPEIFDKDDLYKKIDGEAELYLSAGFVRLKSQRFAEKDDRKIP